MKVAISLLAVTIYTPLLGVSLFKGESLLRDDGLFCSSDSSVLCSGLFFDG